MGRDIYDSVELIAETLELTSTIAERLYELGEDIAMIEAVGEWAGEGTKSSEIRTIEDIQEMIRTLSQLYPLEILKPTINAALDSGKNTQEFLAKSHLDAMRTTEFGNSELHGYFSDFMLNTTRVIFDIGKHYRNIFTPPNSLNALTISERLIRRAPQAAIQHLFTIFEDHLRNRIGAGPEVYGQDLINRAFGDHGSLTHGPVQSENVGVRNLISGTYATFRNPSMHRLIKYDERLVTSILVLIDLLIQLVDEAQDSSTFNTTSSTI